MTIASFFYQRRRLLVFCAATLALHGLAIDWAARHMASPSTREAQAAVMTAQLRVALPKRVESAPLAEVQPLAERPKAPDKPEPKPAPKLPSRPPPPPLGSADSRAITPVASDLPAPAQASVEALLAETAAVAVVEQAAPAAAADPVPPAAAPVPEQAPAARRYKVQLPPSATFDMDVARVDADGTKWSGAATMTWHTDGSRYRASVEAGISLLVTRLNLLVLRSEGTIDDNGIAPDKVTEKRARRAETATHFNRGGEGGEVGKTITFSASGRSFPLLAGAQDKATVPFQLAAIGRADVNQFGADIDIQVGEDKDAGIYRFQLVGEDELDTRMGKLVTWHLTRPPKPGSYSSRLDIWLAPGLQWYPVQIRNTEASGALTTQTVSHIKNTDTGQ